MVGFNWETLEYYILKKKNIYLVVIMVDEGREPHVAGMVELVCSVRSCPEMGWHDRCPLGPPIPTPTGFTPRVN